MSDPIAQQLARIEQAIATIKELDSPNFTDTTITMLRQKATKLCVAHEKSRRAKLVGNILIDLHRVYGIPNGVAESELQVEAIGHTLEWVKGNNMIADPLAGQAVLDPGDITAIVEMLDYLDDDATEAGLLAESVSYVRGVFDGIADTIDRAQNPEGQ
jgi:hypothetical protein